MIEILAASQLYRLSKLYGMLKIVDSQASETALKHIQSKIKAKCNHKITITG